MVPTRIIEAVGLAKTYGAGERIVRALDGVSLEVSPGEMLAVTGESGSGKTTLMHLLGCLDTPDAGTYRLAGEEVSTLSGDQRAYLRNRRIGFVFQAFSLLPRLSALDNVALPLRYAGVERPRERAREALERVGLANRTSHRPAELSGGQQQRVAIARAIVGDPDLLLADEPTGNLDSRTGAEIMDIFAGLRARGRTLVVVSHNPAVARWCDRRIHLQDGRAVDGVAAG